MAGRRVALLPRARRAQHGDVRPAGPAVHLPQPRHSRVRQRGVRLRTASPARCCCGPRRSTTGIDDRPGSPRRPVRPAGTGPRPGQSVLGAGNHHGRQRNRPVRRRQPGAAARSARARRRPTGRGWASARPPTGRGGSGWPAARRCRPYRRSPRAPAPGAQRLIREDRVHGQRRTSSTSWTGAG